MTHALRTLDSPSKAFRRFVKFITTVAKSSQREETQWGVEPLGHAQFLIPILGVSAYQVALTQLVKMVLASVGIGPVAY